MASSLAPYDQDGSEYQGLIAHVKENCKSLAVGLWWYRSCNEVDPDDHVIHFLMTFYEPHYTFVVIKGAFDDFIKQYRSKRENHGSKLFDVTKTNKFAYAAICGIEDRDTVSDAIKSLYC